ncbi:MAG: hypothetical protein KJO07_12525 [Deltaproteobacteria bacterium]|nr:hypothetical protein [Deltaproteobacteria bacterium]
MTMATDSFDIYILMRPFGEVVPELRRMLSPLHDLEQKLAVGAEGYYSPTLDAALLAIRFDRRLAASVGRSRLRSLVASVGMPTITPDDMPFERRCEFFLEHLATYTTYVQRYREDNGESVIDEVVTSLADHVLDGIVMPRIEPKVSTKFCVKPRFERLATPLPR